VTHQGCPPRPAAAPLGAWTHTTSPAPEPMPAGVATTATVTTSTTPWRCRRCATPQPCCVRQGFLRHGLHQSQRWAHPGWRHDHSP
jgi:hypothetical protein